MTDDELEQQPGTALVYQDGVAIERMRHELAQQNRVHALVPKGLDEVMRFSELIARSSLAPKGYGGQPGDIAIAIMMGMELGLSPMAALQNISVINGRPAVWGDAMLAICLAQPDCIDIIEDNFDAIEKSGRGRCTVRRRGKEDRTEVFSIEDAKVANLWGKQGPWTQYPKRMLQMRARSFALRNTFAAALRGLQMVEELRDIDARVGPDTGKGEQLAAPTVVEAGALPPRKSTVKDRIAEKVAARKEEVVGGAEPIELGNILALMDAATSTQELKLLGKKALALPDAERPEAEELYRVKWQELKRQEKQRGDDGNVDGQSEG